MEPIIKWDLENYTGGDGIIVATDMKQEWMLKWWWDNYAKYNNFPVTFFDLGMSKSASIWCEEHGNLIRFTFPEGWIKPKQAIDDTKKALWEDIYQGDLWDGRTHWFTKPFLLLKSPYQRTVWMDLDCEVRKPIDKLFDFANEKDGFSILSFQLDDLNIYNTGVIACRHGSPIPQKWAEHTCANNHNHVGDETLLMEMIEKENLQITPHPLLYNWPTIIPQDANMVIRHHIGGYGKTKILREL